MNNEINNINEKKDINILNTKGTVEYKCIFHCPLSNNDIASAIDLDQNYLIYGTLMGEVSLCLIDELHSYKYNNSNDSNMTNANITLEDGNKNENKNIKEMQLFDNNIYKRGNQNQNKYKNIINKQKKRIGKDIKIYLNKEPNSDEYQRAENINSNNTNDYKKSSVIYNDKIFNGYNSKLRIKKLYHAKIENISCISLLNNVLNFSIGDHQLLHAEKISYFNDKDIRNAHNFKQINNYTSDKTHNEFCETAQCFISNNHYLILYLFYYDFNWPLKFSQIKYENKNLLTFEEIEGNIYMSNFNVPFDFDGDKFLFLEHYSKALRCINIYSTLNNKNNFQYYIKKDFGHISFMKLLPDDCIFLCRKIYFCEIYKIKNNLGKNINEEKDFVLLKWWTHVNDYEIIASNVYIKGNNEKENKIKNNNIIKEKEKVNKNNKIKNDIKFLQIIEKENSFDSDTASKNKILNYVRRNNNESNDLDNMEDIIQVQKINNQIIPVTINKLNNNNNTIEEKIKYYIITLDIEGNFNIYYQNNINNEEIKTTLFNLYDIKNIDKKYKSLKFFAFGFPYYILMNDYYYVVTTDNGIFVINSENEEN